MGYFFLWIILSVVIGAIGSDRKIGFFGAFTVSLLLSPLIGGIIALASKRRSTEKFERELLDSANRKDSGDYVDRLYKLNSLRESGAIDKRTFDLENDKIQSSIPRTVYVYDSLNRGYYVFAEGMPQKALTTWSRDQAVKIEAPSSVFSLKLSKKSFFALELSRVIYTKDFDEGLVDLAKIVED
ncbi:hypothetical protein ACFSQ3_12975 [Sphingobacterium corticis]|uniref:Uncharacterized protein n=1 Tax=Sphingobacterium corticis TaxID=1812823 RepID=A0ABW5NP67_9SPHI